MAIDLAPVIETPLSENFSAETTVNLNNWSNTPPGNAEFIPSPPGSNYIGTEISPSVPSIADGGLQLTVQSYDFASPSPGNSFEGSEIVSNKPFTTSTAVGVAFTAVAAIPNPIPGIDGGIFGYYLVNPLTGEKNEIDFESFSDQLNKEQTNIYSNSPANSLGNPRQDTIPGFTIQNYNTYTIEWFPNEVLYFINGQFIDQRTVDVPQTALQFYLNAWASNAGGAFQPTNNPMANQIATFDVASASISYIQDLNTTLTITGAAQNQTSDNAQSTTPFSDVAISDLNGAQTEQLTVILSNPANGTLSNLGGGSYSNGVYTFSGTAVAATTALDNLVFTPTAGIAPTGQRVTTGFTIDASDGTGATAEYTSPYVTATQLAATGQVDFLSFSGGNVVASDLTSTGLWNVVANGDFNGAGQMDLATQGPTGQIDFVYLDGSQNVIASDLNSTPVWAVHGAGYFGTVPNVSGPALISQNPNSGAIDLLWYNTAGALSATQLLNGAYWNVVGGGDFTGRGRDEIVTQSSGTGQIDLLTFTGTALTGSLLLTGSYDPVVAVDDFNHNGLADITTENPTTGLINHLMFTGTALTGSVADGSTFPGSTVVDGSSFLNHG